MKLLLLALLLAAGALVQAVRELLHPMMLVLKTFKLAAANPFLKG
jgi:hypothetical protein